MLSKDENAVVGMPIYLLVAIVAASIILAVFAISVFNMLKESEKDKVKTEVEKIISEAENMFEYADEGTLVNVKVDLPSSMRFIVFGSMPINGVSEPDNYTLAENNSNNYYFVMDDKYIFADSSNARFSGETTDQIAFFRPGSYNLVLELTREGGRTYVKIY